MAEREGFEPPEGRPSTVFKTAAFNRSATSPKGVEDTEMPLKCNGSACAMASIGFGLLDVDVTFAMQTTPE